jgi:hypothetical protein
LPAIEKLELELLAVRRQADAPVPFSSDANAARGMHAVQLDRFVMQLRDFEEAWPVATY